MKIKSLRNFLSASTLLLAIFLSFGSNIYATETDTSIVSTESSPDVIIPEEIVGTYVQYLPSYKGSSLGTFDDIEKLVKSIVDAASSFEETISFTYAGNLTAFHTEFPKMLDKELTKPGNDYVHGTRKSWKYTYTSTGSIVLTLSYQGTVEQENYATEKVKQIAASLLKPDMTDFDKVLAVNDYVVTHTIYSKTAKTTPHHIYAFLNEGKAVCQAYALVTYRLLTEMGVEARYVVGHAGEAHAWNSVKIDGTWYHLDTTWNDGSFNGADTHNISYRYFLVTSEKLRKDHTWDEAVFPVATDNRYSYMHTVTMGISHNGEFYYSSTIDDHLYKLNIATGNSVKLLDHRVYFIAAHNEYIYFSDYSYGAYLTSFNIITGETKVIDPSAVKQLYVDNGYLYYKVGTKSKSYELPLSATELAVRNVELKIAALSEYSPLIDLTSAREAYNGLTEEQKLAVTNLNKLTQLEELYPTNIAAANEVAAIVSNHTIASSRADLKSVIDLYNKLTAPQQALVSNKDTVKSFISVINTQNADINAVKNAITALKSTSKTYLADIQKVRASYDALSEELQVEVTNYGTLVTLETNTAAAKEASDLISKLDGSSIDAIVKARDAYSKLSTATAKYVTNLKTLTTFEAQVKNVLAAIKAINAIDPGSAKFVSQVTAARKAYDKAGTQKNLVTNEAEFLTLEAQAKVYDQISKLKATSTKYIAEVTAAKKAFDALGETTALVTNKSTLDKAIEAIKPAQAVIDQINKLDDTAESIQDARTAFNALDKTAQKYVTNAKVLSATEKELKNVLTAINAIKAIDPSSKNFVALVTTARKAFDKAGSQQHLVTNSAEFLTLEAQAKVYDQISKLKVTSTKYIAEVTAAKTAFVALGETTALVTNKSTLDIAIEAIKPAQVVIDQINKLDGAAESIQDARTAFNALDKTSQKYVTNLKTLTTKENELKNVLAAINAIKAIDSSSKDFIKQVTTARKAYEKAGTQQSLVTNGAEFLTIDKQAKVFEQISKLKNSSTKYIAEVTAAKEAYDDLDGTNSLVTNFNILEVAIESIKPAQAVIAQIDKLDGTSIQSAIDARDAYNGLTSITKKYVTNLKTLAAIEKKIALSLKVVKSINEIKAIDVSTSSFFSKATALKKAYNALNTENKALITNVKEYNYYIALYEIKNAQKIRNWSNVSVDTFTTLEVTGVTTDNFATVIAGFNSLKAGNGTTSIAEIQMNVTNFTTAQ